MESFNGLSMKHYRTSASNVVCWHWVKRLHWGCCDIIHGNIEKSTADQGGVGTGEKGGKGAFWLVDGGGKTKMTRSCFR